MRARVEWSACFGLATALGLSLFSPACGGSAFGTAGDGASGEGGGSGVTGTASGSGGAEGGTSSSGTSSSSSGTTGTGTTGTGTSSSGSGGTTGSTGSGSTGSGAGGAASTEQWAKDYDQSCDFDEDCVTVVEGDACGCVGCESAAVNREVVEKYQSDWNSIECPPDLPDLVCPAIACALRLPACTSMGLCAARNPLYIEADNYDRSCETDEDCHLISTGEACSACQCSYSAVNERGYEQYQQDLEGVDCTPGPSVCDCAGPGAVHCASDGSDPGVCSAD